MCDKVKHHACSWLKLYDTKVYIVIEWLKVRLKLTKPKLFQWNFCFFQAFNYIFFNQIFRFLPEDRLTIEKHEMKTIMIKIHGVFKSWMKLSCVMISLLVWIFIGCCFICLFAVLPLLCGGSQRASHSNSLNSDCLINMYCTHIYFWKELNHNLSVIKLS